MRDRVNAADHRHAPNCKRIDQMEHRRGMQPHVVAVEREDDDAVIRARDQVGMRQHTPLGSPLVPLV